jgi:hypothetical protein
MYCRTCRRALNRHTSTPGDVVTYRHAEELRSLPVDHRADPIPLAELPDALMKCDFCSQPHPSWVYLCADQRTETRIITARTVGVSDYRQRHGAARTLGVQTSPGLEQDWGQRWAACEGCARLIERRDTYGLVFRVVEAMPAKYTRGKHLARVRARLHATYSNVLSTLHPGRGRISATNPLGEWEPTCPPQD